MNICSIDLSKAFDKMNHHALLLKLMKRQIPNELLDLLVNWFDCCWTCVKWNGVMSNYFKLECGVRQGSVLSPHLFAVYLDDIAKLMPFSQKMCLVMYADDILLLAPSVSQLQKLFSMCELELNYLGMSINAKKSCCLRIGQRCDISCINIKTADGACLPWVKEFRYLGVYIVQSRNFKCSLSENKKSFYRSLNAIYGKVGGFASEQVILQLIISKCVPVLLYGLEACNLTVSDSRSVDFTFVRFMMKLFKTSNNSIVSECLNYFGVDLPSVLILKRKLKFIEKYCSTVNFLCMYCASV